MPVCDRAKVLAVTSYGVWENQSQGLGYTHSRLNSGMRAVPGKFLRLCHHSQHRCSIHFPCLPGPDKGSVRLELHGRAG
jgi:hypothetical protein